MKNQLKYSSKLVKTSITLHSTCSSGWLSVFAVRAKSFTRVGVGSSLGLSSEGVTARRRCIAHVGVYFRNNLNATFSGRWIGRRDSTVFHGPRVHMTSILLTISLGISKIACI